MSRIKESELEVEVASLHQPVYLAGHGATDRTLSKEKLGKDLKMVLLPQGLFLSFKGRDYVIPHAAIGSSKLAKRESKVD